jgi:hypothetical protein
MEGYRRAHCEGQQLYLYAMLRNTLTFKATDSRDKIFALQGFTEAANTLPIDYELALEEVLINTARYFLKRPEGIEVLQQAGIGWTEESDGLKAPSWVVDWSRTRPTESSALSCFRYGDWYLYKAIVEREPEMQEVDNNILELGGLHLDYIKARGTTLPTPPELQDREKNDKYMLWLREAESIARSLPLQYHTGQSQSEAFWRTCTRDRNGFNRPADPEYNEFFLDFREAAIRKCTLDHPNSTPGPKPLSENQHLLQEEGQFLEARYNAKPYFERFQAYMVGSFSFGNALGSACNGRCFAVTEKGYMVVAPPGTKEGDMLCLIIGAQVPFLLRLLSDSAGGGPGKNRYYALVGESYVHGMMDGEGLKQGLGEQNFLIR